jgi:predicted Zn-ribbon and HTH transcriptional regulator
MPTDKPPPPRNATTRASLREALETAPATAHDLSSLVGIPEKQVAEHLEHLARTLRAHGERLVVEPARCLACGYVFRERARLTTPSACPMCRAERIASQRFRIEHAGGRGK